MNDGFTVHLPLIHCPSPFASLHLHSCSALPLRCLCLLCSLPAHGGGCRHDADPDPYVVRAECCPDRSLGNLAAALGGKTACDQLDDSDAAAFKAKLEACAPLYHAGTLAPLPGKLHPREVGYDASFLDPSSCNYGNFAFDAFNALLDKEYLNPAYERTLPRYAKIEVRAVAPMDTETLMMLWPGQSSGSQANHLPAAHHPVYTPRCRSTTIMRCSRASTTTCSLPRWVGATAVPS